MMTLTAEAVKTIEGYKNNSVIMDFVTLEARKATATEIRAKFNGGTTHKAVELLAMTHKDVDQRVTDYINIGLIGCYMASIS